MRKTIARFSVLVPPKRDKVAPKAMEVGDNKREGVTEEGWATTGRFVVTPNRCVREKKGEASEVGSVVALPRGALISAAHSGGRGTDAFAANDYLEAGKFFAKVGAGRQVPGNVGRKKN